MKRVLCLLICLAMALSLLPVAAFAATTLTYVFADIAAPATGEKVSYTASYGGRGYTLDAGNNNRNYYQNGIGWFDLTENKNVPVGSSFEAGHQYKVMIFFSTEEGYGFTQETQVQINGQDALADYYHEGLVVGELVFPRLPMDNPFTDVPEDIYFYTPVLWAVNQGITTGTSSTTFSPLAVCTRAQVVTFLWRAAGKPEPMKMDNPFTDVPEDIYYYKAVLWAVENGITTGTSSTTFSPENPCTRGQVVTFLYRAAGSPAPAKTDNPFKDVPESLYYYNPILWAVEMGITNGTSATTFGPEETCIRAQIVTFLYRFYCRELQIVKQPEDFQMNSSEEFTQFSVEVDGGEGPYTYRWYISYDKGVTCAAVQTSVDTENTFSWIFSDYDFDDNREIFVYCTVTDAAGKTVSSKQAEVLQKTNFTISCPIVDYYMTGEEDVATFEIAVRNGTPDYGFRWYVCYDEEVIDTGYMESEGTTDGVDWTSTFRWGVKASDFEEYSEITVYCEAYDAAGSCRVSDRVHIYPQPLTLLASPEDYQMTSSMEDATFTVEVEGGAPAYTYKWFVVCDMEKTYSFTEVTDDPWSVFTYTFSDYDFDEYREIYVYCMVTDENHDYVISDQAFVLQHNG